MQQIGVCAGGGQTRHQTILEHIGATTSILADYNAGRLVVAVALAQSVIVPAEEATNLVGVVGSQSDSGFSAEAIGSKILSHYVIVFSSKE